ncbi:hypothetical protein GWI33_011437, partial [Rhynchophorus ferrugineus]
ALDLRTRRLSAVIRQFSGHNLARPDKKLSHCIVGDTSNKEQFHIRLKNAPECVHNNSVNSNSRSETLRCAQGNE